MENDDIIVNQAANVTVADDDDMEQCTAVVTSKLFQSQCSGVTTPSQHDNIVTSSLSNITLIHIKHIKPGSLSLIQSSDTVIINTNDQ